MIRRALAFVTGMAAVLLPLFIVSAQEKPAHPHGDLALDCASCHRAEGWRPLKSPLPFQHATTGFPLVAAHGQAGCRDCHRSLAYREVGSACVDCHRDAHRGEMGTQCDACHEPRSWTNRREMFQVHQRTRFPLMAAHARLDCEACHRGKQPREFVGTPTDCVACHRADFDAASDPDHDRLGFATDCAKCHSVASSAWRGGTLPGSFPHPATFPLRGAHAGVSCASCHVNGRFAGTPRECVACHRDDYDRTTNPNHRAANFPTTCTNCHVETAWQPATVDHNLTRFPLTGAHVGVACARCHANGRFAGTPIECVACHQDDYDRTSNPSHRGSGFPTGCPACHTTSAWTPASFDHDRFFPLRGDHGGIPCATCHVTPSNFRNFSCTSCHEHRREEMDKKHDDVRGYSYDSAACYRCHPRGTE